MAGKHRKPRRKFSEFLREIIAEVVAVITIESMID